MILSAKTVVHYLLDRGLLTLESVVDGDVVVIEASRRNRNFKVVRREAPGLFVKQIQSWDPQTISALQREAICYWMAAKEPGFAALAALMPKYELYDPPQSILVTGLLLESETLTDYHRGLGQFPERTAASLGRLLGQYHQAAGNLQQSPYRTAFPKAVPWILSVHQQAVQGFTALSPGNSQMLGIVQRYPEFQRHLDTLRAEWHTDSLIHGDMKWDNCLVEKASVPNGEIRLRVADWELADIGDAGWDVGAILQSYLSFWVFSIPLTADAPLNLLAERAQYPLESMQPALRAFWRGYQESGALADATAFLDRSVKYAAARMIQTVYEYMHRSPQLTSSAMCLLQVSLNMLHRPAEARHELLGL